MIYTPQFIIGLCIFILFFPLIHLCLIMCVFNISEFINHKVNKKCIKE